MSVKNDDEWEYLLSFLPEDWEQMASDTGAYLRSRAFSDAGTLLRTLLIHFIEGCSLRETAAHAYAMGLTKISDVALLKRLNISGEWFRQMSVELIKKTIQPECWDVLPQGYDIRLVDATCISKPGSVGTDWRIHYNIALPTLTCQDFLVTDHKGGETFKNFTVAAKQLFLGDRGYSNRPGITHVVKYGGEVIVRMNTSNLPLFKSGSDTAFDLLEHLRKLSGCNIGDWDVEFTHEKIKVKGRVCAIKRCEVAAQIAIEKTLKEAKKKGKIPNKETLEAARYVFVFTTLSKGILPASKALAVYRGRWQIELAFKRLKSLLELGNLPKRDPTGSKAWIYGKLFSALLIEALIITAERFSPWGYQLKA
jgi:hypothetical protein